MLEKRRHIFYGVEVNESLTWEKWKPGQEYTKYIFLKNVSPETKYLSYRIPKSAFYITKYPRRITLFYGTSVKIPIIFRPDNLCSFNDEVEFLLKEGSFKVPLIGLLPSSDLVLPKVLTFGMCAVKDTIQQTFTIKNNSQQSFSLRFKANLPFTVLNEYTKVEPQSSTVINIEFNPQEAKHYQEVVSCIVDGCKDKNEISNQSISLEAIAKYPHLIVQLDGKKETPSKLLFDYKDCFCGTTTKKIVCLENPCNFPVPFNIIQENKETSFSAFSYNLTQDSLAPGQKLKLPIFFKPVLPNHICCDQIQIYAVGNILAGAIELKGTGIGPKIEVLCPNGINFNLSTIDTKVERSFELKNYSKFPAFFKFQIDNKSSVFQLSPVGGQIPANGIQIIVATFNPSKPINFYRRVPCIIHDQGPLFVELFGTCHDKLKQPAVLKWKHIDNFNKSYQDTNIDSSELQMHISADTNSNNIEYIEDFSKPSKARPVTIDRQNIDFGFCQPGQCYQKTFTITNHTKNTICCSWITDINSRSIFSISPSELDLESLKSSSFKVSFMPCNIGLLSWAEFEGYFFNKDQEDHRTTDTDMLQPPWCLTIQSSGHTFPPHSQPFLPNVEIDKSDLYFPLQPLSQPSFSTLLMKNCGDTPLLFKLKEDIESGFSCKPNMGLINSGFEIITFCALPPSFGTTKQNISCQLNGSNKFQKIITCNATVGDIIVEYVPENVVQFKPTCIGTRSSGFLLIKNMSELRLSYQWIIPSKARPYANPVKDSGILLPLERKEVEWIFLPLQEKDYNFDVGLAFKTTDQRDSLSKTHPIKITGVGKIGKIKVDFKHLDFNNIIVGSLNHKLIRLVNESDCELNVELFCSINNEELCKAELESSNEVEIGEKGNCTISALSAMLIKLCIKPKQQRSSKVDIYYKLKFTNSLKNDIPEGNPIFLCSASFNSVYPMITIDDIRGSGSLEMTSKTHLWNQLSLKRLNELLCDPPSQKELKYKGTTKYSTRLRMPVNTPAENTFDFGSSYHNAEVSRFHLNFNNSGATECQWHLLLPSDIKLQLEHWSEEDLFDEEELHQINIIDNNIFQLEPRHGTLSPGQIQTVTLSYNHSAIGIHKIPVLLKIDCGREIILKFTGTTVDHTKPYLHFVESNHRFMDQIIGKQFYPIQYSSLTNGGAITVHYSVDVQLVESLQKEKYGYTVFECLDPCNEIKAGECHQLPWKFCPLEEKEYKITLPLHIVNGDTIMITIIGAGCKNKEEKEERQITNADCVPKRQLAFLKNQIASLSQEIVDFGYIPLHAVQRLSIFMKNHSEKHPIRFNWNANKIVRIEPDNGIIEQGGSTILKVIAYDNGNPSIQNLDLTCKVLNEDDWQIYVQKKAQWDKEQEEKRHYFTITDNKPVKPKSKSSLSKFSALPPISPESTTTLSFPSLPEQPQQPKPLILHLGVSLETCYIKDYSKTCHQIVNNHFFHKHEFKEIRKQEDRIKVTSSEMDVIENVIGQLISDLLYDAAFPKSLQRIATEPTPYFCMFGDAPQVSQSKDETVLEEKSEITNNNDDEDNSDLKERQQLKGYEPFRRLMESILEETLWNLTTEASFDEIKLTSRPRMIVLPPTESTTTIIKKSEDC